jgi:hypothetical protein
VQNRFATSIHQIIARVPVASGCSIPNDSKTFCQNFLKVTALRNRKLMLHTLWVLFIARSAAANHLQQAQASKNNRKLQSMEQVAWAGHGASQARNKESEYGCSGTGKCLNFSKDFLDK